MPARLSGRRGAAPKPNLTPSRGLSSIDAVTGVQDSQQERMQRAQQRLGAAAAGSTEPSCSAPNKDSPRWCHNMAAGTKHALKEKYAAPLPRLQMGSRALAEDKVNLSHDKISVQFARSKLQRKSFLQRANSKEVAKTYHEATHGGDAEGVEKPASVNIERAKPSHRSNGRLLDEKLSKFENFLAQGRPHADDLAEAPRPPGMFHRESTMHFMIIAKNAAAATKVRVKQEREHQRKFVRTQQHGSLSARTPALKSRASPQAASGAQSAREPRMCRAHSRRQPQVSPPAHAPRERKQAPPCRPSQLNLVQLGDSNPQTPRKLVPPDQARLNKTND